jgi:ATP-dependent helicase/nuclease subunit A
MEEALQTEKRRKNVLDFNDLEHRTVELLSHEETAKALPQRFAEVMVDEYQDTNAVQNAIFDAVSRGGENLFQVGDVKQSIYRFRLADPTIFLGKYARFGEEENGPRRITLSANFRSRPQVLGAVNDLFRAILSKNVGELEYSEDQQLRPGKEFPEGKNPEWNTELDVLLVGRPEEEDELNEAVPKDLQEARFVARRIRALLDEGYPVTDKE